MAGTSAGSGHRVRGGGHERRLGTPVRKLDRQLRIARARLDLEVATDEPNALDHPQQADAAATWGIDEGAIDVEPDAVVVDLHRDVRGEDADGDGDLRRLAV